MVPCGSKDGGIGNALDPSPAWIGAMPRGTARILVHVHVPCGTIRCQLVDTF